MNYYWIIVLAVTTAVFGTLLLHRFHRSPETEATAQRLVAAMTIVTALIYGVLGFFKLEALQMGLWDFGIYDSMLHLAATGQGWMQDFRGGAFDHFSPLVMLLVPLYWIVDAPGWLVMVQVAALTGAAPLLYALSRRYFSRPGPPLILTAMYLLNPYFSRMALFDFHIECLFPLFFFGAFLARAHGRRWAFLLLLAAMPLIKEDFVIPLGAVGLYCLSRQGQKKDGVFLLAAAGCWTLFILKVYFPWIMHSAYWHYGRYEVSPDNLAAMVRRLFSAHVPGVLLSVLLPFALLPAANWRGFFLLFAPVLGIQLISGAPHQNLLVSHYASALIGVTPVAALIGVRTLRAAVRRRKCRLQVTSGTAWLFALLLALSIHILCCDLPMTRYYSYVPGWNRNLHPGFLSLPLRGDWYMAMLAADAQAAETREILLKMIPKHLSVTAQNEPGPLFIRHRRVYSIPGPPEGSDIYVFDHDNYTGFTPVADLNACLMNVLKNPEYRLVFRHNGLMVLARNSVIAELNLPSVQRN